ncbi:MAG: hypothetical protein KKB82_07085, partial [Candidatus Omnitrophica bacterium]|nr:hypothetical protein [Candidatus Omnitrophota bacterium]
RSLESIFIVLKDTPNFSKVLKSAFAFKENNRDFLEPADIALIEEAEKIWNSQIIQGKNIDFERIKSVFYRMIELDKKIAVIEEELARLLLKWGADEKIKDRLRGQSFWPVIESSAGWEALQYFTSAYGKGLEMAPKIYVCNADPLLKKIIGKAMAEKKLKVDIEDFPREQEQTAKLQGSGYYVLSVFDYAENGDESLIEPQLLNIRELLHKQGRFIIILAREQDKNGFRQALRNFGFNIRTTYRNGDTGFHLIETDKGGKIEDSMIRFNKLKGKSDFTPEDEEFLRRFWENVFKREGIFLAANFKGVLQNYITALPADVNFRMMFEQLEQRLAAEDVTKNNFISLRKMEEFLDTLIGKTPALKCSLYDRIGDDGRLIEGLLMRTTPEGKKINWILELEENRFYRQLFKLGDKIENFQINDAGVYKGYEDNSKNHQEKVISNMMDGVFSLLQHLDQMNELHMGLLNDAIDVKKVKAEIEAKFEDWFLCAEKELPSKYRDMMNYLWHGNSLLKGTVFSIIADIWMLQGGVDSEIGKRLGEFSKFADEYKKVSWETMEPKISEALSVLFLLNLWLDYEQKNDLLNLFIRFRIDRFVNEIEDEIGGDSYGARSLAFDLPHARNTPKQKIVFSLLGDNEPDKLFFQNRLIKVFNLSNQVFTFESIYNLQWMMNFNGHEREIYLELLGRITGYFRQKAKMQPDSWRKKAAILDKYINIFVRDAKGKAMIARGRNNPLSKEGADKAIEEEKRLDFIQAMEEEMEASNIHYAIEPEELSKIIATESSLVTLDLLRYLIGLSHKNIDLEDKVKIKNSIKGAIDKINSNFVLVSLMIDAKENAWIISYIAERIIPDKNFRIVVEMICGDGDCSALLIEKNLAARRAIIQILNSGHNEEMIPTVSMIRTYLICDKTSKSLEFLREIWEAFSRKNGRLFQLDGVIRFLFLLEGEDLPEAVLRKSAEIISDVFEKQKDSYTAQEAQELSITVNKILGMIETRITLLSQEEELGYLPERTIIKETVFVDRAI